jgi:hypothetical protein
MISWAAARDGKFVKRMKERIQARSNTDHNWLWLSFLGLCGIKKKKSENIRAKTNLLRYIFEICTVKGSGLELDLEFPDLPQGLNSQIHSEKS